MRSRQREKRIKELEESINETRKKWLEIKQSLRALDGNAPSNTYKTESNKPKLDKQTTTKTTTTTNSKTTSEPEKPPTRAVTRRESSRQNLEKTLATLCKEASKNDHFQVFAKPVQKSELELYNKTILKHVDLETIKSRLEGEVDDPYEILNDLLLMFQNAIMFYPPEHSVYKTAAELRTKVVPHWEKALLDRFRMRLSSVAGVSSG